MNKANVHQRPFRQRFMKGLRNYWMLYLMLAIPMVQYILFRYAPLTGLQVAFKDYNLFKGIAGSPWAGFKYFGEIFANAKFWHSLKNTLWLNLLDLVFGFPVPILMAIMLYEMRSVRLKKVYQTMLYLPHFLSWIIIGGLVVRIFSAGGMVNSMIANAGGIKLPFLTDETNWVILYVCTGIWQSAGYGSIIYLAAISGVNTELYEAAEVDGCGRIRRIIHVTIPCIMPTIITMLILQLGRMAGIGFDRPYVLANDMVRNSSEVISTFVYTMGIKNARYSFSTAVDLFGSLANMLFLLVANQVTKIATGESGLF